MRANIARDRFVNRQLRRLGWTVLRIWEHELATTPKMFTPNSFRGSLHRIRQALIP